MVDEWYYGHDTTKIGPFSGQQLKNLAALGDILLTDTVWKAGVERGVLASKVRYLFSLPAVGFSVEVQKVTVLSPSGPTAAASIPPIVVSVATLLPAVPMVIANPVETAAAAVAAPPKQASAPPKPRKGRAVATKGADMVSQDGVKAKYRKKCTVCGHKDASVQTIVISNKTTNVKFYCSKCKKARDVTIQCTLG